MSKQNVKNYYAILNVPEDASLYQIQNSYQKLASKWHPDKHKQNRRQAEQKFAQIAEAYEVLSDRNRRSNYDRLNHKDYSVEDANSTFQKFFHQEGISNDDQEKFFNEHYSSTMNNYYKILGVNKNSSMNQIKDAYRKQALKYHPKANQGNQEAIKKFVQINQAYNALADEHKRRDYDNWFFGDFQPMRAHSIFDDFFGGNRFKNSGNMLEGGSNYGKQQQVGNYGGQQQMSGWNGGQGGNSYSYQQGKSVSSRRIVKDGKEVEETIEEELLPNGERIIRKKFNDNGNIDTHEYHFAKGEKVPKELTN